MCLHGPWGLDSGAIGVLGDRKLGAFRRMTRDAVRSGNGEILTSAAEARNRPLKIRSSLK